MSLSDRNRLVSAAPEVSVEMSRGAVNTDVVDQLQELHVMAELAAQQQGVPVVVEMDRTTNMHLYRDGFLSGTQELFVTVKCDQAMTSKGYSNSWDSKRKKGEQNPVWKDEANVFIIPNMLFARVSKKMTFSFTVVDRGTMTNTAIHQCLLTIRSDGSATIGGKGMGRARAVPAAGRMNYHRLWTMPLTATPKGGAKPGGELHVYVDCSAVFGERDFIRAQKARQERARKSKKHHHARKISNYDVKTPRTAIALLPMGGVPRQDSRACMTDTEELPGLPRITGIPSIAEEVEEKIRMPSTPIITNTSQRAHASWKNVGVLRKISLKDQSQQILPSSKNQSLKRASSTLSRAVNFNTPASPYPDLFAGKALE